MIFRHKEGYSFLLQLPPVFTNSCSASQAVESGVKSLLASGDEKTKGFASKGGLNSGGVSITRGENVNVKK